MPGILMRQKKQTINPNVKQRRNGAGYCEQESRIGGDRYLFDTNGDRFNANTATLKSSSLTVRGVEIINGKKYTIIS